jgi:hypothetical protein
MDRKRSTNGMALALSWSDAFGLFSLELYERQGLSQRVNTLYGLKGRITRATANVTKDTLQRAWQGVNYRWDVGFEVLTAVMKSSILWDIIPCSWLKVN